MCKARDDMVPCGFVGGDRGAEFWHSADYPPWPPFEDYLAYDYSVIASVSTRRSMSPLRAPVAVPACTSVRPAIIRFQVG